MMEILTKTSKKDNNVQIPEKLIFGRTFSTHVFEMDFDSALGGWNNPVIKELDNINMNPAAMVLHYGQAIFEGLKAFKQQNGKISMFRPDKNIERMNSSARRLCMPEIDPDFFLEALRELVALDKGWVPDRPGYSLYIRPVMYAYDPFLGVRPGEKYKFIIISKNVI